MNIDFKDSNIIFSGRLLMNPVKKFQIIRGTSIQCNDLWWCTASSACSISNFRWLKKKVFWDDTIHQTCHLLWCHIYVNINIESWSSIFLHSFWIRTIIQLTLWEFKNKNILHKECFEYTCKVIKEDKVMQNCIDVQFFLCFHTYIHQKNEYFSRKAVVYIYVNCLIPFTKP